MIVPILEAMYAPCGHPECRIYMVPFVDITRAGVLFEHGWPDAMTWTN